jgi:hypothetical protein
MDTKLQRDVLFLKAYSIVITVVLGVIAFTTVGQATQHNSDRCCHGQR